MTRALTFTAHGGRLLPRQLPGQHVALALLEVPAAYTDAEALAIVRAVADGRQPPLERRLGVGRARRARARRGGARVRSARPGPGARRGEGRRASTAGRAMSAAQDARLAAGAPGYAAAGHVGWCGDMAEAPRTRCRGRARGAEGRTFERRAF